MLKQQTRTITRLLPLAVATALAACAAKPLERAPPVELPDSFSHHRNTTGDPVADRWWQAFDDAALTQLVNRALDDNLSLKASYQRLLQARAVADRQSASLFPSVDTSADAQRQESDTTGSTRYSAGLNASYEVDLWGRVRAQVEAEELRASASLADYQAAAISLSGEIASTWFRLVEQRAQSELARDQLKTNQDVLRLIETRFATGLSGSADVLRQRQLVSSSRERLYNIEAERRTLEHQLAVLLGQSPGRAELPASKSLPELPPLPDTGIPAELVQQRPDIRQAWQLVAASDKDLAAAISDRFPRFSIEASVTSQSADAGDLFDNWLATLAGNLVMPLIDGGQRQAEVRRTRSVMEQRFQEYGQTVLTAIQEVEDALTREQQQVRRLEQLEQQIRFADATYRQLRTQYLNGIVSYIEVLSALQDRQDLRRTRLTARQQLLGYRVALYRALAGSPGDLIEQQQATNTESNEA